MLKIKRIKLDHLRNNAHYQFQSAFRKNVEDAGADELKIAAQYNGHTALFEAEDVALKKIVKSALTEKIRAADAARDDIFSGMAKVCEGMCKHFTPAVAEAARQVKIVLDTYGNVAALSLNEETGAIVNLLQDLRSAKYADAASACGMTPWAAALEARNNAFDSLVGARFNETAALPAVAMREARRAVDASYLGIVERVEALIVVEGESAYADFVARQNAVVDKYSALLARKHKKDGASGSAGDEEDEDEDEEAEGGGAE
ncbi:hypothetical protein R80B4_02078 [Fibrobacteres bacterium R8-0-B4]